MTIIGSPNSLIYVIDGSINVCFEKNYNIYGNKVNF